MATFTGYLRARSDDELVALLLLRPDLATPSPSTLTSLAARATSRTSLERALAAVDAGTLQVLEAVVALDAPTADDLRRAVAGPDADPEASAAVGRAVDAALARLLVHPDDERAAGPASQDGTGAALSPAPGLAELFGPYPAGLAPADVGRARGRAEPDLSPEAVHELLGQAPAGARAVLDALLWGPPVGRAPSGGSGAGPAVAWLLRHGLLAPGDARHVVLPRAVALALRGGRTHKDVARPPEPASNAPTRPAALVAAESAAAGERVVRLVSRLARAWEQAPPPVLRSGGLGVRELRRAALLLDVEEDEAAFVVELASAAGLVADDGEETPSFVPTVAVDEWHGLELPVRWAQLARTWLVSSRASWLVGGRDDRGGLRAALDPELQRPWVPRLRRAVLDVLAQAPGAAVDAHRVLEVLRWRAPRAVPPEAAVAALLVDAGRMGVLGAGALSPAGAALLAEDEDGSADPAEVLAADLPHEVDDMLLQGDLTGIVLGRPSAALEELLDDLAHVESRGGALTVRFTPDSVRGALDAGRTAEQVLTDLAAHTRGPVPQPLEYLVRDAARRHGRLRVGAASSYLRSDDPLLLAGLADDPRLADLGLVVLAPTVLAAQAGVREMIEVLRERGLAPAAEGPDGQVLHVAAPVRRVGRRGAAAARRRAAGAAPVAVRRLTEERLAALVPELRRAETEADAPVAASPVRGRDETVVADGAAPAADVSGAGPAPAPTAERPARADDPVGAVVLLREAAAERATVWVELVGANGMPERRLLRPLRVEGGRLRALDPARESELTVAVHRIASASWVTPEEKAAGIKASGG